MKHIEPGMMLYSTDLLKDSFFENTVILITEIKPDGPVGFIINRIFERKFNELVEFQYAKPLNLFVGGPMEPEKLFFLHRRSDLIPDGQHIVDEIYLGGDFSVMLNLMNTNQLKESEIKLVLGYCGWDTLQLEAEIEEGTWTPEPVNQTLLWEE